MGDLGSAPPRAPDNQFWLEEAAPNTLEGGGLRVMMDDPLALCRIYYQLSAVVYCGGGGCYEVTSHRNLALGFVSFLGLAGFRVTSQSAPHTGHMSQITGS